MRNLVELNEAQTILEPFYNNLVECIEGGFEDFKSVDQFANTNFSTPVSYNKRTKATLVHDHIRRRVIEAFENMGNGIEAKDWKDIFALKINDDMFVRFKKFNSSRYTGKYYLPGYPTPQFKQFLKQGQISGFPDKPTFIFVGYIPNFNWTEIDGIYIACWLGDTCLWIDDVGRYSLEQLNLFKQKNEEEPVPVRRVRVKENLKNKDSKTGTDNT